MLNFSNAGMLAHPMFNKMFEVNLGKPMDMPHHPHHPFGMCFPGHPMHKKPLFGEPCHCKGEHPQEGCGCHHKHHHRHMRINIIENENDYTIMMCVPGRSKEDLSVFVDNEAIHIKTIQTEETVDEANYIAHGFKLKPFEEIFEMPENADLDNVSAKVDKGILTVIVAKKVKSENVKQIEIE